MARPKRRGGRKGRDEKKNGSTFIEWIRFRTKRTLSKPSTCSVHGFDSERERGRSFSRSTTVLSIPCVHRTGGQHAYHSIQNDTKHRTKLTIVQRASMDPPGRRLDEADACLRKDEDAFRECMDRKTRDTMTYNVKKEKKSFRNRS